MALTSRGRTLTAAHRRRQLRIAARGEAQARQLWKRLDVASLDASEPSWMAANVAIARDLHEESAKTAAAYLTEYRDAEIGDPVVPIVSAPFPTAQTVAELHIAGPVRVKAQIAAGQTPIDAHASALTGFAGMFRRDVLHGGRMMIHEFTRSDPRAVGYRRVTDGSPCPFCGMLASRGPVYASRQRAENIGGSGLRYHGGCGCTAEIVYGEWQPTDAEATYIERYASAAAEVDALGLPRTEANIMPILRREWPT